MNILVLGGTGAMGSSIIDILVNSGHQLVVTSRKKRNSFPNVKYIQGNAKDKFFLDQLLQISRWDAIIDFMVYSTEEFGGKYRKFLNSTDQYIYLSSARVYANSEDFINEDSSRLLDTIKDKDYLRSDEYAIAKARQEDLLFYSGKKNWTIVRPYITYNTNRLQLGVLEKEYWLYDVMKGRPIVFSEDIANKYTTLTHGKDVANSIASLVGEEKALGEHFHVTSNDSILWKDVLSIYYDEVSKNGYISPEPILQKRNEFLSWYPGYYQVIYDREYHRKFDNSKISKFVNVKSFIPANEGLRRSIQEFINTPNFNSIDWNSAAIKGGLTGHNVKLSEIKTARDKMKYQLNRFRNCLKVRTLFNEL